MDESTRRAWSKPELIVIVRGKPEEAVLTVCKYAEQKINSPFATFVRNCWLGACREKVTPRLLTRCAA